MDTELEARIPAVISHEDYLAAIKPLFDLLRVSPNEVVGALHVTPIRRAGYEIDFKVIATPDVDPRPEFPDAIRDAPHPQGDEFAIFTHDISVEVFYG